MSSRRGKKINPAKNEASARDFSAGKRIGRPRQVWVWDEPMHVPAGEQPIGHWETTREKANAK